MLPDWPHWSGAVSQLTNDQVRDVIMHTAEPLGSDSFSNEYGHGRIHAGDAVAKAGWIFTPSQINLNFIDIPEGETQLRAIKISVNSFHSTSISMVLDPAAPFTYQNGISTDNIGKSDNFDTPRELYIWIRYQGTTDGDSAMSTLHEHLAEPAAARHSWLCSCQRWRSTVLQ